MTEIERLLDVIEGLLCAASHDDNEPEDEQHWPDAHEEAEAALMAHGRL